MLLERPSGRQDASRPGPRRSGRTPRGTARRRCWPTTSSGARPSRLAKPLFDPPVACRPGDFTQPSTCGIPSTSSTKACAAGGRARTGAAAPAFVLIGQSRADYAQDGRGAIGRMTTTHAPRRRPRPAVGRRPHRRGRGPRAQLLARAEPDHHARRALAVRRVSTRCCRRRPAATCCSTSPTRCCASATRAGPRGGCATSTAERRPGVARHLRPPRPEAARAASPRPRRAGRARRRLAHRPRHRGRDPPRRRPGVRRLRRSVARPTGSGSTSTCSGEAILGDDEADRALPQGARAASSRPDVDYVSVKISALCANLDVLA